MDRGLGQLFWRNTRKRLRETNDAAGILLAQRRADRVHLGSGIHFNATLLLLANLAALRLLGGGGHPVGQ